MPPVSQAPSRYIREKSEGSGCMPYTRFLPFYELTASRRKYACEPAGLSDGSDFAENFGEVSQR